MGRASTRNRQSSAAAPDLETLGQSFALRLSAENRSPRTVDSYLAAIRLLDEFLAANAMPRAAADIEAHHVAAFLADQLARLKPASAANRHRSLVQFFKFLVKDKEIERSPMETLEPPRVPDQLVPVLGADELRRLLKACDGQDFESRRDRAMISLLIDTGIRRGELAGLALVDIELTPVRRQDASVGGRARVTGKGDRPRPIAFSAETASDIDRYLRARTKHPRSRDTALWLGLKGKLSDSGIAQALTRRATAAGLGHIHLHQFRHTFAHTWLDGGGSEGDLMMLAGWKSRTMLMRYGRATAQDRALNAHAQFSPRNRLSRR